jgi:hypothetical protein
METLMDTIRKCDHDISRTASPGKSRTYATIEKCDTANATLLNFNADPTTSRYSTNQKSTVKPSKIIAKIEARVVRRSHVHSNDTRTSTATNLSTVCRLSSGGNIRLGTPNKTENSDK